MHTPQLSADVATPRKIGSPQSHTYTALYCQYTYILYANVCIRDLYMYVCTHNVIISGDEETCLLFPLTSPLSLSKKNYPLEGAECYSRKGTYPGPSTSPPIPPKRYI